MAQIKSNLDTILTRIKARLIDQVSGANSSTCFISDDPDTKAPNPGDFWYVVSPSPTFQFSELFEGGHIEQAEISTVIVITVHSSHQNDEPGRAEQFFNHATRGIFPEARLVIKALAGHFLQDASGNEILSEPMHPADGTWVRPDRTHGSIQIGFHVRFDQDLTT